MVSRVFGAAFLEIGFRRISVASQRSQHMRWSRLGPGNTQFVIFSFEGPDGYSMAGGLGSRISNLSATLAQLGYVVHHFFIGDPNLNSEEVRQGGKLVLHRWCQWISQYHPAGVYDGEDGKVRDFNESLPCFVKDKIIEPAMRKGDLVVVLGEEWQTAEAMCRLSDLLADARVRDRAVMFWNANNTFSFHRIDWRRLDGSVTITTVSRYMKHIMWKMGVNPIVVPNGIPKWLLWQAEEKKSSRVRDLFQTELLICKVARWDIDKGWDKAIESVAYLKKRGLTPVLFARGGIEPYGELLIGNCRSLGLSVSETRPHIGAGKDYLAELAETPRADVVAVKFHLPLHFLYRIYQAADAVLANSGHEPFGLVGLETMACGGVAFTGSTGEDYAIHLVNSIVLETADPREIASYMMYLRDRPEENDKIRSAARDTARYFTWEAVVQNLTSKIENQARIQGALPGRPWPDESTADSFRWRQAG